MEERVLFVNLELKETKSVRVGFWEALVYVPEALFEHWNLALSYPVSNEKWISFEMQVFIICMSFPNIGNQTRIISVCTKLWIVLNVCVHIANTLLAMSNYMKMS